MVVLLLLVSSKLDFDLPEGLPFDFSLEIFIACECALSFGLASWCVAFGPEKCWV